MLRMGLSAFLILHGFVHLLYFGHSRRYFELTPGLSWPDGSWALSRVFKGRAARHVAAGLMLMSAGVFMAAGLARFFSQDWWPAVTIAAASVSSISYLLLWDGSARRLPDQGGVGLVLNGLAVLLTLVLVR